MESVVRQTVMHRRSRASLYFLSVFAAWDRGSRTEPEVTGWQAGCKEVPAGVELHSRALTSFLPPRSPASAPPVQ